MLRATISKNEMPVLIAVKRPPCISVIMPFNPKMIAKPQLDTSLKNAYRKVQEEVYKSHDANTSDSVINKLQHAMHNLDYTTHNKSIAIYVSATVEKVYYLNVEVRENVTISSSFEIRNIVLSKKDVKEFLLLNLNGKQEKIYVGNSEKIKQTDLNNITCVQRDLPEVVSNFTDSATIKAVSY